MKYSTCPQLIGHWEPESSRDLQESLHLQKEGRERASSWSCRRGVGVDEGTLLTGVCPRTIPREVLRVQKL